MANKTITTTQAEFRRAILEELKPELVWYNDCINVRIDFKDEDHFHIHIIEDYQCHLHIRGTFDGDSIQSIDSVVNHSVSRDIFDETMNFLQSNY